MNQWFKIHRDNIERISWST